MKKIALGMVLLFGFGGLAQQATPPVNVNIPTNLKPYFVVFYVVNANSAKAHENHVLMEQHLEFARSLAESGKIALAGPFTDQERIAGMFILTAASAEDAKKTVSGDPIVRSGSVDVEVHSAMLPDLSAVKILYSQKKTH